MLANKHYYCYRCQQQGSTYVVDEKYLTSALIAYRRQSDMQSNKDTTLLNVTVRHSTPKEEAFGILSPTIEPPAIAGRTPSIPDEHRQTRPRRPY